MGMVIGSELITFGVTIVTLVIISIVIIIVGKRRDAKKHPEEFYVEYVEDRGSMTH